MASPRIRLDLALQRTRQWAALSRLGSLIGPWASALSLVDGYHDASFASTLVALEKLDPEQRKVFQIR